MSLAEDTITFGKYKDFPLSKVLRDPEYCKWLLQQDWFQKQYEYLYNRVKEYSPRTFFIKPGQPPTKKNFLEEYEEFRLLPVEEVQVALTEPEKSCYKFYLSVIKSLRKKIIENRSENIFDIKAPKSWLISLEKETGISREVFKEFLRAYGLKNITTVVEEIKRMGGIEYKGARSYIIAKQNSLGQEQYWENILKKLYGEEISVQYKYRKCIFDFVHIKRNTLYECKLDLKDFSIEQYRKYTLTVEDFILVYLIARDCIINMTDKIIYTTEPEKYITAIPEIEVEKFCLFLSECSIEKLNKIEDYFSL